MYVYLNIMKIAKHRRNCKGSSFSSDPQYQSTYLFGRFSFAPAPEKTVWRTTGPGPGPGPRPRPPALVRRKVVWGACGHPTKEKLPFQQRPRYVCVL